MFKALQHIITTTYNSHQHRVLTLHGDCEKVNTSLASPLGSLGITLQTSPPGEHAQRVERSIGTLRQLTIATLSALPYHLPLKYTLHLHKAIAAVRNTLINVRSSPSTPDELVRGVNPYADPSPSVPVVWSPNTSTNARPSHALIRPQRTLSRTSTS